MASVINLPSAPNTGLSRLGDVILGLSGEYAQNRRQDEVAARQRAERLADIEEERAFQQAVAAENRLNSITDMDITQMRDDISIARKRAEFLEDQDSAQNRVEAMRARARAQLEPLLAEELETRRELESLNSKRQSLPQGPTASKIQNMALEMARNNSKDESVRAGKKPPPEADRAQYIDAATTAAWEEFRTTVGAQLAIMAATEGNMRNRLADVRSRINTLTSSFNEPGDVPQPRLQDTAGRPVTAGGNQDSAAQFLRSRPRTVVTDVTPGLSGDHNGIAPYKYQGGILGWPLTKTGEEPLPQPQPSPPPSSPLNFGSLLSGLVGTQIAPKINEYQASLVEDEILRTQPNSQVAEEIRRRRGMSRSSLIDIPTTIIPPPRQTPIIQVPPRQTPIIQLPQ